MIEPRDMQVHHGEHERCDRDMNEMGTVVNGEEGFFEIVTHASHLLRGDEEEDLE